MDKRELKNALALLKVRKKEMKVGLFCLIGLPVFALLLNTLSAFILIFQYNPKITTFKLSTYTETYFFFSLLCLITFAFLYNTFNREHEVFPQTNKSRFLSYALFNYELFFAMSAAALITYLLQYGILSTVIAFNSNVHLAYDFSLSFVLLGFIVNFLYGSLFISLLLFLGTLDRKYPLGFKLVAFFTVTSILINNQYLGHYLLKALSFLTKEPSIVVFILKALILWIIISLSSWFINSNTVYYKSSSSKYLKKLVGGLGFGLVLVITITVLLINVFSFKTVTSNTSSTLEVENHESLKDYTNVPLDASHLKEGDSIVIRTNCNFEEEGLFISPINADDFGDDVALYGFHGKVQGLQLSYKLPSRIENNIDLTPYIDPKLTVELKGTNLYLNYDYNRNQKLFYLSPYSFMGQFDAFKDKNFFKDIIGYTASNRGGEIYIFTENGINISTPVYTTIN